MLFFLLVTILGLLVYYKIIKPTKYWKQRDVVHVPSWPLVGNLGDFVFKKKHVMYGTIEIYNKYPNERFVGFMQFTRPMLLLRDLELIKQIGVKEFDHFHDHIGLGANDNDSLLSKSLINLRGEEWKRMRATLSPVFTSSKMKNMYHLMAECAENLSNHFQGKEQVAVEMKDVFSRFTNDVIATTAFGIKVDSLKESNNEFFTMGQKLTAFGFKQGLKFFVLQAMPAIARLLHIQLLSKDVMTFFRSLILDNMSRRKRESIVRPDLIHLMMEAQKGKLRHESDKEEGGAGFATVEESHIGKTNKQMELTDDLIVAQAFIFFFAGFDTASTASSFMAYELALNPDVQKKLQDEIDTVNQKCKGTVPYDTLLSMKYLDQVLCETLRKWPPGFQIDRLCTKDYVIQPTRPEEKPILLEKGTSILLPVIAIHWDPQYYDEPDRFDPERFSDENKPNILPGTYLPFGVGPRNCIGSRFALLEVKILFFHLLSKFDIVPIDKTEIPLKISPKKINLAPENGFHLGLKPRKPIFYLK